MGGTVRKWFSRDLGPSSCRTRRERLPEVTAITCSTGANSRAKVFHKDQDFQAFLDMIAEASLRQPMRILAYCLGKRKKKRKKKKKENNLLCHRLDAQPFPSGSLAPARWGHQPVGSLAADDPSPSVPETLPFQRACLAGPIQILPDPGGRSSPGGAAIRRTQPVAGRPGGAGGRLGLVQPARAVDRLLGPDPVGPGPGARGAGWVEDVNAPMFDNDVARVRQSLRRDRPLGDPTWTLATARTLGLESSLRPRGIPS